MSTTKPQYCGSCGSCALGVLDYQIVCKMCGTDQGRFIEKIIVKGFNDGPITEDVFQDCFKEAQCEVELDTAGTLFEEHTVELMLRHNIKFELVTWTDRGGWPSIKYTGSREALAILINECWGDPDLINDIKEIN